MDERAELFLLASPPLPATNHTFKQLGQQEEFGSPYSIFQGQATWLSTTISQYIYSVYRHFAFEVEYEQILSVMACDE